MDNFLPLFPESDVSKKMEPEYLNEIILHAVLNAWTKQSYLQGWDFELKTYKETCAMFEQMEVSKQFYKGVTPSKTTTRIESNRDGHISKRKGGEDASPTNPKKGCTGKRETKNAGHPSDAPTRAKLKFLMHGLRHNSEECKVLNIYSEKYAAQQPHKNKETGSSGKPKHVKTVEFDENTQEVNVTENCDNPIPRKKKGENGY